MLGWIHHRPLGAGLDPSLQGRDLCVGETVAFGGHDLVGIVGEHSRQEFAVLRLSGGHSSLAGLGGLDRGRTGVESKITLLFVRSMTFRAALHQDGFDVLGEVDGPGGVGG